jgi:hypothetical protein
MKKLDFLSDRQRLTNNQRLPLFARLSQQPIAQAELNHQTRSAPRRKRRWTRWLDRGFVLLIYGTAFVLFANQILVLFALASGTGGSIRADDLPDWFRALVAVSVIVALIIHFRRMFQTLALSADSIARERNANNWDMLVLTGIDARKIVIGKWWATVRRMARPYIMLGILRALLIVWYGAYTNPGYYGNAAYAIYYDSNNIGIILHILLQYLLAGIAVFVLTIANLLFTAACGLSAFNKRSGIALARAITTRQLLVIGFAALTFVLSRLWLYYSSSELLPVMILLSLFTVFDNGVVIGVLLPTYNFSNYYPYGANIDPVFAIYLPAAILALIIYVLLTVLFLRLAQWQAIRQGALRPLKRPFIKIADTQKG